MIACLFSPTHRNWWTAVCEWLGAIGLHIEIRYFLFFLGDSILNEEIFTNEVMFYIPSYKFKYPI